MDASEKDKQKAEFLAFLLWKDLGGACTPEDLSSACIVFQVSAAEIRGLCTLPNAPLRLDGSNVAVSKAFEIRLLKSFESRVELLHDQTSRHVVGPASAEGEENGVVARPESTLEPTVPRSDNECVNAFTLESLTIPEIRPQIESGPVLLPAEDGLAANGDLGYECGDIVSNPLQGAECRLSSGHDAANIVSDPVQVTECRLPTHATNPNNSPHRIEEAQPAAHSGKSPCKALQQGEKADVATTLVENLSITLHRTENSQLAPAPAPACLPEQDLELLAKEVNAQPKTKSREPRFVPRFDDYAVEGEVGAGGYGTVYKVLRLTDGQVFAMKCPLENTHDSCVRNEISMLKRLRGKDHIIQFQSEVIGKVSPMLEAAGGGEEVNCPSILLEFIEHDKPEVLKKEITIDELQFYCVSLFGALAQLHKERILHLDIKPGNFLFSRSTTRGCLVDFNLARDESAKRLSSKRTERGPSRAGTTEYKALEKKKCPKRSLVHEDAALAGLHFKRHRLDPWLPRSQYSPANKSSVGDQRKETVGHASAAQDVPIASPMPPLRSNAVTGVITLAAKPVEPLKVNESIDNTRAAQQLETPKTQQTVVQNVTRNRHLQKFFEGREKDLKENVCKNVSNQSAQPLPQLMGVPALKPNPNKRVPAGVPLRPEAGVQPPAAKRPKPAVKLKGPCNPVKDGPCVGTRGYRAPEVLMRSTRQSTKVDIWSAGVSLLQLVTGRSPFPSTSTEGALKDIAKMRGSNAVDKLAKSLGQRHRISKDHYPGTSVKQWSERHSKRTELKGRIPSNLYDLIEQCLDVNPDSRITAEAALLHSFCLPDRDVPVFSRQLIP